jgi:hypothetical protein
MSTLANKMIDNWLAKQQKEAVRYTGMTYVEKILATASLRTRRRIIEIERDCRLLRRKYAPRYQPLAPFEKHVWQEKRVLNEIRSRFFIG